MRCPRRDEIGQRPDGEDAWREDDTCSYCGSLNPALFMAKAEAREITLGPTDKTYKVYVESLPNPHAGQRTVGSSRWGGKRGEPIDLADGEILVEDLTPQDRAIAERHFHSDLASVRAVSFRPEPTTRFAKFYFQHLSDAERVRFVELLNAGVLRIGMPGRFYVLPFFMVPA